MKAIIRVINWLTRHKRAKHAQEMRFERLSNYLSCCRNCNHLYEYDKLQDETLIQEDYQTLSYCRLMAMRFHVEKQITISDTELQNIRIREGESILRLHGL